jgi:hypothetical protein
MGEIYLHEHGYLRFLWKHYYHIWHLNTANINVHSAQEIYIMIHRFKDYVCLSSGTLKNSFTKNTVEFLQSSTHWTGQKPDFQIFHVIMKY